MSHRLRQCQSRVGRRHPGQAEPGRRAARHAWPGTVGRGPARAIKVSRTGRRDRLQAMGSLDESCADTYVPGYAGAPTDAAPRHGDRVWVIRGGAADMSPWQGGTEWWPCCLPREAHMTCSPLSAPSWTFPSRRKFCPGLTTSRRVVTHDPRHERASTVLGDWVRIGCVTGRVEDAIHAAVSPGEALATPSGPLHHGPLHHRRGGAAPRSEGSMDVITVAGAGGGSGSPQRTWLGTDRRCLLGGRHGRKLGRTPENASSSGPRQAGAPSFWKKPECPPSTDHGPRA